MYIGRSKHYISKTFPCNVSNECSRQSNSKIPWSKIDILLATLAVRCKPGHGPAKKSVRRELRMSKNYIYRESREIIKLTRAEQTILEYGSPIFGM